MFGFRRVAVEDFTRRGNSKELFFVFLPLVPALYTRVCVCPLRNNAETVPLSPCVCLVEECRHSAYLEARATETCVHRTAKTWAFVSLLKNTLFFFLSRRFLLSHSHCSRRFFACGAAALRSHQNLPPGKARRRWNSKKAQASLFLPVTSFSHASAFLCRRRQRAPPKLTSGVAMFYVKMPTTRARVSPPVAATRVGSTLEVP